MIDEGDTVPEEGGVSPFFELWRFNNKFLDIY